MRAPGANPSEEDLLKISGGKSHVTKEQFLAAMGSQKLHQDVGPEVRECFAIFDA